MRYDVPFGPVGKLTGQITTEAASIARYRVWMYGPDDKNPKKIFEGASDDELPDVFTLPSAKLINNRLCVVEALLVSATNAIATTGVRVNMLQDGKPLFDDPTGVYESGQVPPQNGLKFQLGFRFKKR